jgi:hypothetical protein
MAEKVALHGRRRRARPLALAAAVLLTATVPTAASARTAVGRPAGAPDLSQMAVQPADLPPGTVVEHQGYVHETGYVAAYKREYGRTRVGHARLIGLQSEIALDKTADDATLTFLGLSVALTDKRARSTLARVALQAVTGPSSSPRVRKVVVGRPRSLDIGDGALVLPFTFHTALGRIRADLAFGVLDRVETTLVTVAAPGSPLTVTDLKPLVTATANHVRAGLSPINTAAPAITGTTQLGHPLAAAPGAWSNSPQTFAYQWQHCDANGAACVDIPGATGQSYNAGLADVGSTVRVAVTATNKVGHATVISPPTPVVT